MNYKEAKKRIYGNTENMEALPNILVSGGTIVATDFLKDHSVIMYTKEEGGGYHYAIVEKNKVGTIVERWIKDGDLVLPVPGSPKAFDMVDIFKAYSVYVLEVKGEYTKIPTGETPDGN
jgi:hypothetical protein